MQVMRSKHGKTALVISGNQMIKVLVVTAVGPQFDMLPYKAFSAEYAAVSNMTVEQALYSFLGVAKRAYRHNSEVVNFLWEQIVSKNLSEMTLNELVLCYNSLARSVNKPERKAFDSKAKALEAISALDEIVKAPTPNQVAAETKRNRSKTMTEATVEKKPRGKGIGARAKELILEGKSNQEVIDTIKEEIEGANPTTATIAWYKNKLRQEGKLPATNRKKKGEAAEGVAEDEEAAE